MAGNEAIIELYLKYKADLNLTDNEGHTVIHLATANGHVELIDYLLSKGAKLNRPDKDNAFALHYAVQLCAQEGKIILKSCLQYNFIFKVIVKQHCKSIQIVFKY